MKNDCNIVRDLMPLVIDGAASEESAQIVEEHVTACEPCATVYEELKGEIHAEALAKEQAEFEKAAKQMQRRRTRRKWLTILISLTLTLLLLVGCCVLVDYLHEAEVTVSIDSYDVQFALFEDSNQLVSVYTGMDGVYGWGHWFDYDRENGTVRIEYYVVQSKLPYPWQESHWIGGAFVDNVQCKLVDGQLLFTTSGKTYTVTEVVLADDENERLIYRAGDTIHPASDELRTYYGLVTAYNSLRSRHAHGESVQEALAESKLAVEEQYDLVPEFQTK